MGMAFHAADDGTHHNQGNLIPDEPYCLPAFSDWRSQTTDSTAEGRSDEEGFSDSEDEGLLDDLFNADPRDAAHSSAIPSRFKILADSIGEGEYSRGFREACQGAPTPNTEQTRQGYLEHILKVRHTTQAASVFNTTPPRTWRPTVSPRDASTPPPDSLPFKRLAALIRRQSKRSSGGPSGWTFELMRRLEDTGTRLIQAMWEPFVRGTLPREVRDIFRMARGVPIAKKGDLTSIRPLAVGECFRRILSKAVCESVTNMAIEDAAGPFQFAAGTKNGTDMAGMIPRLRLELTPRDAQGRRGLALVSVDCKSAFNY